MFKKRYLTISLFLPTISYAQEVFRGTNNILGGISGMVSGLLIPMVFTLALLFFFYGVAKYIWQEGSSKEDGRRIMVWGVIALFVMSSVWGIVRFLQGELGIGGSSNQNMNVPTINSGNGSGSGGDSDCYNNPYSVGCEL